MDKRKHRCLSVIAAFVLFSLSVLALLSIGQCRHSGITRENLDRIQVGMTEAEVEEILGNPPGWYRCYDDRPLAVVMDGTMARSWWIGDEGIITIEKTADNPRRVTHKEFDPIPPEDLIERWIRRTCQLLAW